jgi:excisionase family DNA binding protein
MRDITILKVRETAQLLNIAEKTLYQWVEQEKIPHYKLNGAVRFNSDEIVEWINLCKKPVASYNAPTGRSPRKGEY